MLIKLPSRTVHGCFVYEFTLKQSSVDETPSVRSIKSQVYIDSNKNPFENNILCAKQYNYTGNIYTGNGK